jgi:hypothetical protein
MIVSSKYLFKKPMVYIITSDTLSNLYKIGFTTNIHNRIKSFNTSIPGNVQIKYLQYYPDEQSMKIAEKLMHYSLSDIRYSQNKEWFKTDNFEKLKDKLDSITIFLKNI